MGAEPRARSCSRSPPAAVLSVHARAPASRSGWSREPHYGLYHDNTTRDDAKRLSYASPQRRDLIDEDFLLQLSLLAKSRYGAANTMLTGFSSGGGMGHHMYAFHADKFDCFVPMSKGLGSGFISLTPTRAAACAADVRAADDNYDDGADGIIDVASTFASYLTRLPGASHTRNREAGTATTAITLAYTGAIRMECARVHPMPHRVPKDELGDSWDGVDQAIRFGREAAGIQHL